MACIISELVTRVQVNTLITELRTQKATVTITEETPEIVKGLIKGKGIEATFLWVPTTLAVTVNKKPWYVSCGKIRSTLKQALWK